MRIQTPAIKAPSGSVEALQRDRASRWRVIVYTAAGLPFLLIVALAWLRPDFNRTEVPDWRPVLVLANEAWQEGDLYEARHLYLQADRLTSWRQDWQGMVAAACGIHRMDGARNPYSTTFAILLRAMIAAESGQQRQGMETVAEVFTALGADKAAQMVRARIRDDWPEDVSKPVEVSALGCGPGEGS